MYGIIHKEIFESTLMAEGYEVAYVFMSMISLADNQDCVRFAIPSFALRINMPQGKVEHAISRLSIPDPESGSSDFEGRRIIALKEIDPDQGRGWFVVNREKYIEKASKEKRRIYMRDLMREKRGNANKPDNSEENANKNNNVSTELAHINININKDKDKTVKSGKKPDAVKTNFIKEATEIIIFLNNKTGKNFQAKNPKGKPTANAQKVMDRLKDGYTIQQLKTVVARKCRDWLSDDKMRQHLTPETLFRKSNFEKYLGECVV